GPAGAEDHAGIQVDAAQIGRSRVAVTHDPRAQAGIEKMERKVRPLAAWILLGLLGASLAPPGAALAADVWIELWLHETSRTLESVAVGDVDGDGRPELVALNSQGVTLYALEEDGPRFLAGLPPVPEQPSAVAVQRRSQDQEAAVWVGTRSPGITYVFRFDAATRS